MSALPDAIAVIRNRVEIISETATRDDLDAIWDAIALLAETMDRPDATLVVVD